VIDAAVAGQVRDAGALGPDLRGAGPDAGAVDAGVAIAEVFTGSSWKIEVIEIVTASSGSGSTTPAIWTETSLWFGGQSVAGSAAATEQSSG
jgi:hypothetical protein